MMPSRVQLKPTSGWFAAGRELQQAATLLSDGAFKLFVWLCLHAERASGVLCASAPDLARALRKTKEDITRYLEELSGAGVCRWLDPSRIEIQDRFWPYQRAQRPSGADQGDYVNEVKRLFLQRACVRSVFTSADETLAAQLHQKGVSLQCIERAIWLGCLRKYAALLNHRGGAPVTSLHYFTALFEEVERAEVSDDYWRYVASKLRTLEQQWRQLRAAQQANWARSGDEMMETK